MSWHADLGPCSFARAATSSCGDSPVASYLDFHLATSESFFDYYWIGYPGTSFFACLSHVRSWSLAAGKFVQSGPIVAWQHWRRS